MFFRDTSGLGINIAISEEHSIATLLKQYLARIGKSEEFAKKNLCFCYNGGDIKLDRVIKIKDFFKSIKNPNITVNDRAYLIGV